MKIALYGTVGSADTHHELPFWHRPKQPSVLFDSKTMGGFRMYGVVDEASLVFDETGIWDMLKALESMELPNLMAHVSMPVNQETQQFGGHKRTWINITTLPVEEENGIPLVIKDGQCNVFPIWTVDNGQVTNFPKFSTTKIWVEFFTNKISEEKLRLSKELEKLEAEVKQKEDLLALYPVLL